MKRNTDLDASIARARRCLETSAVIDRDTLLALQAARGRSLRFLSALELRVLADLAPALSTPVLGRRLCRDAEALLHPLVLVASREVQLEQLVALKAPEVVLDRLRSELEDLRQSPYAAFDASLVHGYPDDAALFPAYQHDLAWMRAVAAFLATRASGADAERARLLSGELSRASVWLLARPYPPHEYCGAGHFAACALDVVSQADEHTDQDLMEEIAVREMVATTGASEGQAWTSFFEDFWLPAWDALA